MKTKGHRKAALRRKYHVRKKVIGTSDRPRLSIFRSNRHIYAQIIDDTVSATLVSASSKSKSVRSEFANASNQKAAAAVGELIAKEAIGVGIKCVCFDRNRYKYHGRVRSLAESARKAGLAF